MNRGRPFEGKPIDDIATRVSISWPKNAAHILDTLNQMVKIGFIRRSRSDIIVNAVSLVIGTTDITKLEGLIVDRCATGRLPRPPTFKNFEDLFEWYMETFTVKQIIDIWGISKEEMARVLFKYCLNLD